MMKKFDIKEKVCAFLLKEDGKISKKNILKAGIVLGAIALAGKAVQGQTNGNCPKINATIPQCSDATPGCQASHTNAAHDNNLNVKNMFGKLVLSHGNCIETSHTHGNYVPPYDSSHASGASPCSW